MKRDTVINILLIIAGIVLAIALFGAGAVWKGKVEPTRPSVLSAPGAGKGGRKAGEKASMEEAMTNAENAAPTSSTSAVVINGSALSLQQIPELAANMEPRRFGSLLVRLDERNVGAPKYA
jgi:hypothetical protein